MQGSEDVTVFFNPGCILNPVGDCKNKCPRPDPTLDQSESLLAVRAMAGVSHFYKVPWVILMCRQACGQID